MTPEERTRIQQAARRYVREQAPVPPVAILEQVARVILQARITNGAISSQRETVSGSGQPDAA
jgi:hypothetical protein